jgi:hypothetical protein
LVDLYRRAANLLAIRKMFALFEASLAGGADLRVRLLVAGLFWMRYENC